MRLACAMHVVMKVTRNGGYRAMRAYANRHHATGALAYSWCRRHTSNNLLIEDEAASDGGEGLENNKRKCEGTLQCFVQGRRQAWVRGPSPNIMWPSPRNKFRDSLGWKGPRATAVVYSPTKSQILAPPAAVLLNLLL